MSSEPRPGSLGRHLGLSTVSFALCFAVWGLMSAAAPTYRTRFSLSGTETALLIAVPVLLGSLARVPLGLLSDRFGARAVFVVLMGSAAIPVFLLPFVRDFSGLLGLAFLLGVAGASFAVGVSYVSGWAPAQRQGAALGIYGLGTGGQSVAVFLFPLLAQSIGWDAVFRAAAIALVLWGVAFAVLARNPPARSPKGLGESLSVLRREPLCWLLALFYFLTFGGFVAFSIYLPTYLRDAFGMTPGDAGFRAAGFVVVATLFRPAGGWLADRTGGARVLSSVFFGLVPFALLLCWPALLPFSVGALGSAVLLGLGNGAVFKLVPQHFPAQTGAVTGIVGAMGGLGGFFPPLLLGVFRDSFGVVWPGFLFLAATALALWVVNRRVLLPREEMHALELPLEWTRTADRLRAGLWATVWTALLVAAIVVGSRNLQNFDPALVVYTFAVVFALWGVAYHYWVWIQKPPTQLYWRRGWELVRSERLHRSLPRVAVLAVKQLLFQSFIRERSPLRWWMHQLLFWGCLLAAAITFPLVFGWIHFGTEPADQMTYVTYLFGFPVASFRLRTVLAGIVFHGLDIAAVLVLAGVALSLWRRMRERGAQAVQTFGRDFFPLVLLFAISVTGLMLTVSTAWFRGISYGFLSLLHAITVIAALLYLPFGKFFHIFQRPAQLGVKLYQEVGERGEQATCARCREPFASRMHIDNLAQVLRQLDFDYRVDEARVGHWQALCPRCKRITLAASQLRLKEPHHGEAPATE